ncbi:hypothetical protein QR680_019272 [Steinernema hermaphroditum]|uniref:Uncharacterized protein n=1 Tax=Steinernema hermaphroditum TaxID=289476 RepID=A0AA39LSE5_9BILA|nr:hypothetical protein QR680_019272 [Steinernema hermaphroditum]
MLIYSIETTITGLSNKLKIKIFDDFLRSIFFDNAIPDTQLLKQPGTKEADFFVRSYVFPHSCDMSELTVNLTTCIPGVASTETVYNVRHMGFVNRAGSAKLGLKLPSVMTFKKNRDGAVEESEILLDRCKALVSFNQMAAEQLARSCPRKYEKPS